MKLFSVKNKVVFITGTSRGIGKEIAQAFLKLGAIVIGISRNKAKIIKHKNYHHLVCDLQNFEELKSTATKALKIKNKIDVIINNAGITEEQENNIFKSFKIFTDPMLYFSFSLSNFSKFLENTNILPSLMT